MNNLILVHPGTLPEARAWAAQWNIPMTHVLSARQVLNGALRGRVSQAVTITPLLEAMARPTAKLRDAVRDHNHIARATLRASLAERRTRNAESHAVLAATLHRAQLVDAIRANVAATTEEASA